MSSPTMMVYMTYAEETGVSYLVATTLTRLLRSEQEDPEGPTSLSGQSPIVTAIMSSQNDGQ